MNIIIISTSLVPPDQNAPVEEIVHDVAPAPEIEPPKTGDPFYSGINKLTQDYQTAPDSLKKEDILQEIYNYPMGNDSVGSWLAYNYRKFHPQASEQEALQQARIQIWQGIDQEYRNHPENAAQRGRELNPVTNIIGWLKDQIKLWGRRSQTQNKINWESDRFTEYEAYLKPFMIGVRDHTDKINPDLLEQVDSGAMKPEQAAWAQYKRNVWNDQVDPQTGKTRIENAKAAFQQQVDGLYSGQINEVKAKIQGLLEKFPDSLRQADPKAKKTFDKMLKDVMRTVPRSIDVKSLNPLNVGVKIDGETSFNQYKKMLGNPEFSDQKSPLFLNGTMFQERASPEMLNQMWTSLNSGPTQSVDTQDADSEQRGYDLSSDEGHALQRLQDAGPLNEERKKMIIEQAPEEFLAEYNDDPEIQQKIQDRLHLIQPFVPAKDKMGNPIMDGNRPRTVKNPAFKQAIDSIINSMYGTGSKPRRVLDERGRPKSTPRAEERTKDALYQIGQFYANSIDDTRDEQVRLKELERSLAPYVQEPLALRHYDGPPLKASQQYALALREVMLDIMDYLGNDKAASTLESSLGRSMVAEFKSWIRTATFLYINRIIEA